jgi:hypothetical protein
MPTRESMNRNFIYLAFLSLIIISVASCTDINQSGTGNSACANNADCGVQPSPNPDSSARDSGDPSGKASGSASAATTFASSAPSPTKVPLAVLCNAQNAEVYVCGTSYGGTQTVGGTLFQYYGEDNPNGGAVPPIWDLVLQFSPTTTCTRLVLNFAPTSSIVDTVAYLQVIQSRFKPVTASARDSIGTLTVKLDGGPFEIQADSTDGSEVVVNGYGICNSSSGE